jgi:hypothetical protein
MSGFLVGSSAVFIMDAPIMVEEMAFALGLMAEGSNAGRLSGPDDPTQPRVRQEPSLL